MKGTLITHFLLTFTVLLFLGQSISCPSYFQSIPYNQEQYCIKCDVTCASCSGGTVNSCASCPADFTLNSNLSFCTPPSSSQINTITTLYHIYGFSQDPSWSGGTPYNCGVVTFLQDTSGLSTTHLLTSHYGYRVLVSVWWVSCSGAVTMAVNSSGGAFSYGIATPVAATNTTSASAGSYQAYCTNSRGTNYDTGVINNFNSDAVLRVSFSGPACTYGIREYVFIQYGCYTQMCLTCNGPNSTQCTSCADTTRAVISGTCLCDSSQNYFKYPFQDYCVKPCPSLAAGQYYGDSSTKNCVLTCPLGTFSSDVNGQCVSTCPASITLGGVTSLVYYDLVNLKCVTICPSSAPYSFWLDSKCYSTCPTVSTTTYYKLDTNMSCVDICSNTSVPLFADSTQGKCVYQCVGADYWGDILTLKCTASCSGAGYFQDNSTDRNLCTYICPYPEYFGDAVSIPAQPACVTVCPPAYFGDSESVNGYLRKCVSKCSGSYYGLQTGNRACVQFCPTGTWGEIQNYTCVSSPFNCAYAGYADNSSHKCIGGTNNPSEVCSNGMYKLNSSKTCEFTCPSNTFASDVSFFCQNACTGIYFADAGVRKCVTVCSTQGTYADVGSGNKCVTDCNASNLYPFREAFTKTCVNKCPDAPFTYADSIVGSCVFNCTPGYYSDQSVTTNKTCVKTCYNNYFAYNLSDSGSCILRCPEEPPLFGDVLSGERLCVSVCQPGTYGDQDSANNRHCVSTCPPGWFAQNDDSRLCVRVCNSSTFGRSDLVCVDAINCPVNYTGDASTRLCVNWCPQSQGTFADNISKMCVSTCPKSGSVIYYADPSIRWCLVTCNVTNSLFGNNSTQTCQPTCLDNNSFADAQSLNRFCISFCTWVGTLKYYRNNYTLTCVVSTSCPTLYFADNSTLSCLSECPIVSGMQTWGFSSTQTCVAQCYGLLWGDASTGIPKCISLCPSLPAKWSYDGNMTCMTMCPTSPALFGEDFTRTCVANCMSTPTQTYSYDITRRCLDSCPNTTYADYIQSICFHTPQSCLLCAYTASSCLYRWGNVYNNSCTYLCTGPTPWDTYGDNLTYLCTTRCSVASYADNYTGTRICVAVCPGIYDSMGIPQNSYYPNGTLKATYDSFGDNNTQRCVLTCLTPNTWADWQTHRCEFRCTGDVSGTIPTFAENVRKRCTVALSCPQTPDKLYGENITRTCVITCLYTNVTISWADNITRTCLPQCLDYTNLTTSVVTRFYGDKTTNIPICVISCSISPRMFGQNDTNLCVAECPDFQYGDQTGNRSCVVSCPSISGVMWFSQLTERICVIVCETATYGNRFNSTGPHCQTVGTDCPSTYFGDNSTTMCVPICPASMNYFGDPSTKLCTDRCPTLLTPVLNVTVGINLVAGYLFADLSTRLCVYMCPAGYGIAGTYGDNSTNTCVDRCPTLSYGDPNTINRYCVVTCTSSSFADDSTTRCVSKCPSNPPTFGYSGNWTCLSTCPPNLWADSSTRLCSSACNPNFRVSILSNVCVSVCPSDPDLYGDGTSYNCSASCSSGLFADPTDRMCKGSCLPLFEFNLRCVKLCPSGYFANLLGNCVIPSACDSTYYGQNLTTKCVNPCPSGSYADPISRYCIAVCPSPTYADSNVCVTTCQTPGTAADNITKVCQSACVKYTYIQSGLCVANCTNGGFRNDLLGTCASSCPGGLYADPTIYDCVSICPTSYYRKSTGFCVPQVNGCNPQFADFVSGNCVAKCSNGYWGYTGNYTCLNLTCPTGMYGFSSSTQRTCYAPLTQPATTPLMFGDPQSGTYVAVCPSNPIIYFGDRNRQICVSVCQAFAATSYFGDPQTLQCQTACTNNTYTADPATSLCSLKCTYGTFRYDTTVICVSPCPVGYGDYSTRRCVATCPIEANTFGMYNTSSGSRLCVTVCPSTYFSEPLTRTCTTFCPPTYFAYNATNQCRLTCLNSFADLSNRRCMDRCLSVSYPNADNSTNKCVLTCPSLPDYYSQNNVCVYYCQSASNFADPSTRKCVSRCPNVTGSSSFNSYGDVVTSRCQEKCSSGFWGDNSTNKCVTTCPPNSYADNTTGKCVALCPIIEGIYADPLLHVCGYTCSGGYFGSQVNQSCIGVCDIGYYGDPTTTLCTSLCPSKIYSYGQNVSRTCVSSCQSYSGYADNYTRLCRDHCQNTIPIQTFIDYNSFSCVQICPQGYYAYNVTNECLTNCLAGSFADNYSQYCVAQCPDNPQTYGDQHLFVCIYNCRLGQFSDNSTNLCVGTCPPSPDYFGDSANGRCVKFCSDGSYAVNSSRRCESSCSVGFADNLTRRCVTNCPPSETTYADSTTHKCVRICPSGYWAENVTQTCMPTCPTYGNGTQSYSDILTQYCVGECPFSFFGRNDTHKCVTSCSVALDQYGHFEGRVCVAVTNCYPVLGVIYYADSISRTCVQKCPLTLWADIHVFKCVPTCNIALLEYRNRHTQMCVSLCPSDPDEYADPTSGNCVRTCPDGSFAYWTASIRQCVLSCGIYSLYADNTTNRCVPVCPTQPFMYSDINVWQCVLYCSNHFFADNKTQTCVSTCPVLWSYFGNLHTFTCVTLCPFNQFSDAISSRTCQPNCAGGYFSDNDSSTCVAHCQLVKPFYYQQTSSGTGRCVNMCPGESYGYNSDQTCKYQNLNLSSSCPGLYFADRQSRQCVELCPNGAYSNINTKYCENTCAGIYFADPILRQCGTTCSSNLYSFQRSLNDNVCVQYCPSPYFAQNSTKSCVLTCSTLLALDLTRTCESYCPPPYFANAATNQCVLNCTPIFADIFSRSCVSPCPSPSYANSLTFTCDLICPSGYFGRNTTRMCFQTCLALSYADSSLRICVAKCPQYPLMYADDRSNECVVVCSSPLFGLISNRTCLSGCPNASSSLIYLADSSNRLCVLECVNQAISFADYSTNRCTQLCPSGTFASNYSKQCLPTCPIIPNNTFALNSSRICMQVCPLGTYGMSLNLYCVTNCWWPYYADPTTNLCVQFCPDGYFAQNETATCRSTCLPNSYADPVTHRCLGQCPALHLLFNYDNNWSCLAHCPGGFYANTDSYSCVSICNSSIGMYAYGPDNSCVRECPVPYRGYAPNHTCILTCPQTYFYDITINVCSQCDSTCIICIDLLNCLQCKPGFNLFNGICNISCVPTTIITYANPSGVCVTRCPIGYYGDNTSYVCLNVCPNKQYGSNDTNLCTNCAATCAQCSSASICSVCEPSATLAIDSFCYANCNATHKYSYKAQCWNSCPSGTYLTYTNVICSICSSNCLTCIHSSTSCLSCATTYYFNSTCLSVCPSGYYGSLDLNCLTCVNSTNAACSTPLNFTTSYAVQNYQYVITMKFNQNVSISKQIEDLLKVKLQVNSRRRLDVTALINNGISYTYSIQSDGTIKLYLILADNLVNPVFTVEVTDPTAIVSITSNTTLQNVVSLLSIPQIDYYSADTGINAPTNMISKFTAIFMLLLYAIAFIWSDSMVKPLQILQLLFFHALVKVNVPASITYFLLQFKLSYFSFVTNWFDPYFTTQTNLYTNTPQKIIDYLVDYSFLRNLGQIFIFLVIFASLWLIFLILSRKKLFQNKLWHNLFNGISQRRFGFMIINDVFSVFYVPMLYFGLFQFSNLFPTGGIRAFNGFLALILTVGGLVLPFVWLIVWGKRSSSGDIKERFWFLGLRVKSIQTDQTFISSQEGSELNLKDEKKSGEKREVPHIRNVNKLETIIAYIHLLLNVIWMVGLYDFLIPQMALLITTNALYLFYLIIARPYINHLNTIFMTLNLVGLILFESFFIYFQINENNLTSAQKTSFAFPLLIAVAVVIMLAIIWSIWRTIWDAMNLWQNFKKSPFYLVFGDVDHVVQEQKSQVYEQFQKLAVMVEPELGDILIENIKEQCNEKGEKKIKVMKKVLRKKKKALGRVNREEPLQSEENPFEEEFVRINSINPFDTQSVLNPIKVVAESMKRRGIDDDVRDVLSEEDQTSSIDRKHEAEEEEKKIDIEEDEFLMQDIDDLNRPSSELEQAYQVQQIETSSDTQQQEVFEEEKVDQDHYQEIYSETQPVNIQKTSQDLELNQIQNKKIHQHQNDSPEKMSMNSSDVRNALDLDFEEESEAKIIDVKPNEVKIINPKGLEQLLVEEEGKKKNLLFLFDDFEE